MENAKNLAARQQLAELSKKDYMSPLFAAVAKAIKPAVVEVRVREKVSMQQTPPDMQNFFERFFGQPGPQGMQPAQPQKPRPLYRRALGSGVIVDAQKGYVLTNWHVVRNADRVEVVLADNGTFPAVWVRTDPQTDLAVVKINAKGLIAAPLGNSDSMEVGNWVLAIGAPEGLPQTVTAGIISAKGRTTGRAESYEDFLQTDAAINHGNSGGPLVNTKGQVIGINTAIISRTGVNEGIGLAIPSNLARNIMDQLIKSGKVTRGYLGVSIQNVTNQEMAKSLNLPGTDGALVAQVAPNSPASRAGFKPGDFITGVNGQKVKDVNELRNAVAELVPGKTYNFTVYRKGKEMTVPVKIVAQPADMASAFGLAEPQAVSSLGIQVAQMNDQLAAKYGYQNATTGVVITDVTQGSDAANQGLRPGMLILQAQGKSVTTVKQFRRAVSAKEAQKGAILVVKDASGAQRYVYVTRQSK